MNKKENAAEKTHDLYWDYYQGDFRELENLPRLKLAVDWLKNLNPESVLDIGCGPGYLAKKIKTILPDIKVDGIDFSSVALAYAQKYLDKSWKLNIDSEDIPTPDRTYDAIVCMEFLEHIYDLPHLLSEIKRLLKNEGKALVSVPNLAYWRYRLQLLFGQLPGTEVTDEKHIHVFTLESLINWLKPGGLRVNRVWGYGEKLPYLAKHYPKLFSSTLYLETGHE